MEYETGWRRGWLLRNGRFTPDHKLISHETFTSFCRENSHTSLEPFKLFSLHYVHKLMHGAITEVLLLSRRYLNISIHNEVRIRVTYFAGWCWSLLGCCNGRNQLRSWRGLVPHKGYQPSDLRCARCSVGQSSYGQWPHPDPTEKK